MAGKRPAKAKRAGPRDSIMIDCHIHTRLCGHAHGVMEAYVQRALAAGLKKIAFLDHLTDPETETGNSMTVKEIPLYFQAVQRLKRRYQGRIDVAAGLEVDFTPAHFDGPIAACDPFDFDVIGGGLHFPGGVDIVTGASPLKRGGIDADEARALYFNALEQMVDRGSFDFVCHFDLIKKFGGAGSGRSFETQTDRILAKIKAANLAVEVNGSGFDHPPRESYPGFKIVKKCFARGIDLTIGSDAHRPDQAGRGSRRILKMIKSAGYSHVAVFSKRKKERVPIDSGMGGK